MKEYLIRKKAIEILEKDNWITWYPPKVKWRKEGDIFGVFDLICVQQHMIKFIQLTTLPNIRTRERKVRKWVDENKIKLYWAPEIWGYDKKNKQFKIIRI